MVAALDVSWRLTYHYITLFKHENKGTHLKQQKTTLTDDLTNTIQNNQISIGLLFNWNYYWNNL